jgi:hypothetical protein
MNDDVVETPDSADPEAERNARKEERARARADADVVRNIMRSKEGRAWLYRKLKAWHLYDSPFYPGQSDVTAFRLGELNCATQLEIEVRNASLDLYVTMLKDQRDEEKRLDNVKREERTRREADLGPISAVEAMAVHLPPPPGYPGGPPVPPKPKQ